MHILVMNYEWPPIGGGASPVCQDATLALAARGHTLDVVTMGFGALPREESPAPGVRVHRVPCWRRSKEVCQTPEMATYILPALLKARALHRRRPFDVNYTYFVFPTGLASYLLYRWTGLPYVISSHGSDLPGHNPDRFQLQHKLLRPLWGLIARNARHIHVPSPTLHEVLEELRPGVPTSVIPNGIHPWPEAAAAGPGRGILAVSRLFEFKGLQYLIEAAALAGVEVPITIVGEGPFRPALERLAREREVPVRFTGWLERDSEPYRRAFGEAGLFVFPSERESFGMVLLEGMMAGLPCIAAAGGMPERLLGEAGLTFKARDSQSLAGVLTRLLGDEALRGRLGTAARERASQYEWPRIAQSIETLLESHCDRRQGTPSDEALF